MSVSRFFEDFAIGMEIIHATPRTLSAGDVSSYLALYGGRFAPQSSAPMAQAMGYRDAPIDDWLVFHIIFGKSVPDISVNAIANLGYAEGRFLAPVYAGDTLTAVSTVLGLRENRDGQSGIVYVRTVGANQVGQSVLSYCRWVMVRKRHPETPCPQDDIPVLAPYVAADDLIPPAVTYNAIDPAMTGSPTFWEDYAVGQIIDHGGGTTLEEAEHMMATRLYQNTARVHFDAAFQAQTRFKRRLVYGGHVISIARALSFNGLENAFSVAGLNAGRHVGPIFAGDTLYAASQITALEAVDERPDIGAMRVRQRVNAEKSAADLFAVDDILPEDASQNKGPQGVLDLDIWLWVPRRGAAR